MAHQVYMRLHPSVIRTVTQRMYKLKSQCDSIPSWNINAIQYQVETSMQFNKKLKSECDSIPSWKVNAIQYQVQNMLRDCDYSDATRPKHYSKLESPTQWRVCKCGCVGI